MSFRRRLGISRRAVLRGVGATLALPWLESLQTRDAQAQVGSPKTRFLPIYLPNGAPELWKPLQTGSGAAWALSSVLEPLAPLKARCTVLSGLENGSVFNRDGNSSVEPAHGRQPAAWLTCVNADETTRRLDVEVANGVSADQLLARTIGLGLPFPSLQVGLSTTMSYCDAKPCSFLRSVSWSDEVTPTGKIVDPHELFALLTGGVDDPEAAKRRRLGMTSVLDAVKESAGVVRPKLSTADQRRLDEYLNSVGELERRMPPIGSTPGCEGTPLPPFPKLGPDEPRRQTTADYDKAKHADLMNDLILMAFQCNATRVISYMLEDEHSEYVYDHVPLRKFTTEGSVEDTGTCGEYSGAQHGPQDTHYATITWWNVLKVSELCQKLASVMEEDGRSILDNTVVFLGSCMHGANHACNQLPALLVGGGSGTLRTDQHIDFGDRPLRDLYFTLLNQVFGLGITDFGTSAAGRPIATMSEILV